MHPNPIFRAEENVQNLEFARERAFGVLAVSSEDAPMMSHVPFLLNEDGTELELHLVRSNQITRKLNGPRAARIAVSGPDSYVSPDWYEIDDQVPTWNYVAIHITGTLEQRPQEELLNLLQRQSEFYEKRLLPKPIWKTDKMSNQVLERMLRMVVPFRMRIDDIEGTWKLNQNKTDEVRLRAAGLVEESGVGSELKMLAGLMRNI